MQIARTGGARIYWLAVAFVSTSITARLLGPEGRGVVAAASGWVALFASFAGLSMAQVILFIATGREESEWLPKTLGTVLAIIATMTLVGWAVAFAGANVQGGVMFRHLSGPVLITAFAVLPLMMWNESALSFFVATGLIDRLNLWQVVAATSSLAAVVLFVTALRWGVLGALLAMAVYQMIVGAATLITIERRSGRPEVDRGMLRTLIAGGMKLHLSTIASFAIVQANVLLVNALRPAVETGLYQLAVQLISAIQMFPFAVNVATTNAVTRDGPDVAWPRQKQLLVQSCAVSAAITAAGFFLAPVVIRIVGGPRFMPAVPMLRILLVSLVAMNFSAVMSSQWIARGMFLRLTAISAVTALISAVLNWLLIPRYGAIGSAWVTVGVYGSGMIVNAGLAFWVERRQHAPDHLRRG